MAKRDIRCAGDKIRVRTGRIPSTGDNVDDDGVKSAAGSRDTSTTCGGGWRQRVVHSLFSPSVGSLSLLTLAACLLLPTMLVNGVLYPLFRLVFGTLYPAYASYKAVRGKDVKEYVKWMMYWIVFALFTSAETFTDVFLGFWFPFYYEVKVILVFWLLSPMTKGSSFLYRKFVHPMLSKREQDIDEYIARAKDQGYSTVLSLGTKGVNYATAVIMQTAIKGGGGLVNQLRRSYSLSDISVGMDEMSRAAARANTDQDRTDSTGNTDVRTPRQRSYTSRPGVEMYFPEVDVDVRQRPAREPSVPLSQIRSTEDVSSGYSSAEPLYARPAPEEALVRTSSVGSTRVTRTRSTRAGTTPVAKARAAPTEDSIPFDECEESDSDDMGDEFFDVLTSTSPVINVKPISYTVTMHEATLAAPVTKEAAIEEILSPVLKTFSDSLLEMYLGNVGNVGEEVLVVETKEEVVDNLKELKLHPAEIHVTEEKVRDVPRDGDGPCNDVKLECFVMNTVAEGIKTAKLAENERKSAEIQKKVEPLSEIAPPPMSVDKIETTDDISVEAPRESSEDAEFFDTESTSPPIEAYADGGPAELKVAEAKLDRAGKYHKRPAPCPPKRTDGDSLSPDDDDVSYRSADSRGSPSPWRKVAAFDLPESVAEVQRTPEVIEKDLLNPATATVDSPKVMKQQMPNPVPGVKPKAEAPPSPSQQKKPKESPMSRLLAKFFSHEGSSRGLVATSLTNITGEIEAELRSASSLTFLGADKPPKLPPKPQKKEVKEEPKERSSGGFRIRDMSHSPPRRKSDI